MSALARSSSVIAVPAMPVVPAADTARTVIGPDDPTVVRIIGVGIVVAVEEMPAVEMRKAMAAEVTETATVPASAAMEGVEASTMKSITMKSAAMETAAVKATTAVAAAAAMTTASNLYQLVGCGVGGR